MLINKNSPNSGKHSSSGSGGMPGISGGMPGISGKVSDYHICTNCYLKTQAKESKEVQTDSTGISDDNNNRGNSKERTRRKSRRASILDPNKAIKNLPTQQNFNDALLGASLTRRMDTKNLKGNLNTKIKTTKKQAFNFNHPSSTVNFSSFEVLAAGGARDSFDFRLFSLSKSGFSGSAKGFKLPNFVYIFVQK